MKPRIVFIGGTLRGYQLYLTLLKHHILPLYSVFLKEDEHEILRYSAQLAEEAATQQLPYRIGKKLTADDYEKIATTHADMIIVCGWRTLINPELIKNVKIGMLAAHDSLLPKYRGFAPLNWAIINGENETGVTIFKIGAGEVDSGDICVQKKVPIGFDDYAWDVYLKIIQATIDAYLEVFRLFENNQLSFSKQNEAEATYTCKRCPEDGRINWNQPAVSIYNLIRGIAHPYPGAFFYYKDQRYYVRKASLGDENEKKFVGRIAGRVIKINADSVEVLCGAGSIKLYEIEIKETGTLSCAASVIKSITDTLY